MNKMIEQVTRAIRDAGYNPATAENIARIAIKAMRELPEEPGPRYTAGEYSRRTQEAMVDEALR